jgi:inosine-uridine nucleoside N-ribohydrolase
MARKVILDMDPGVDGAIALCLALAEPALDVLAVTATGGAVSPDQATRNVQALVEQLDPTPRPRLGAAFSNQILRTDARDLFGVDGLCGIPLAIAERHHQHPSTKVICDQVRAAPGDVTIVATGPLSNIAAVLSQQPDIAPLVGHLIICGGAVSGQGNVTAAAEFNIYCDAEAARTVFRSPVTKTLIPIDITNDVVLTLDVLEKLPKEGSRIGELVRRLLPAAFRAYHERLGLEGIHARDAVAVVAAIDPDLFTTEPMFGDVETEGEITHGVTVFDRRRRPEGQPNMDVVVAMNQPAVVDRIVEGLTKGR